MGRAGRELPRVHGRAVRRPADGPIPAVDRRQLVHEDVRDGWHAHRLVRVRLSRCCDEGARSGHAVDRVDVGASRGESGSRNARLHGADARVRRRRTGPPPGGPTRGGPARHPLTCELHPVPEPETAVRADARTRHHDSQVRELPRPRFVLVPRGCPHNRGKQASFGKLEADSKIPFYRPVCNRGTFSCHTRSQASWTTR